MKEDLTERLGASSRAFAKLVCSRSKAALEDVGRDIGRPWMAVVIPPCDTTGLIDLCGRGAVITNGDWFTLQVSNLVWYLVLVGLLILAAIIPFPVHEVDYTGYEAAEE